MYEKFIKFITSSDGKTISLRIKSAAGFIVLLAGLIGFQTDTVEIGVLADNIGQLIAGVGLVWTTFLHIKGWAKAKWIQKYGLEAYEKTK